MARRDSNMFGVIFVTVIIISQLYDLSYAQQCTQTCTQTGFARLDGQYDTVNEFTNDRGWENEDNFGNFDNQVGRRKRSAGYHANDIPSVPAQVECYVNLGGHWYKAQQSGYSNALHYPKNPVCVPNADIGCAPRNFRPQPGEPGGGAIPSGEGLRKANYLLESLGLSYFGAKPVANFPPYADGKIFSPRTYLKSEATIFTEPNEPNIPFNRYNRYNIPFHHHNRPVRKVHIPERTYEEYGQSYGVAWNTTFRENEPCSLDANAYNPCITTAIEEFYTYSRDKRQRETLRFNAQECRTMC